VQVNDRAPLLAIRRGGHRALGLTTRGW
jgi:hypothetical protein